MLRRIRYFIALGSVFTLGAGGWVLASQTAVSGPRADQVVSQESGTLDGMTFISELGPAGKPGDVEDKLIFNKGTFSSDECDRRCGYPPAPYFTRRVGTKVEFFSTSRCLHKDATLVWRGTIEGGVIRGKIQWTVKRWYRTVENEFWFEGKLVEGKMPSVSRN